MPLVVDQKAKKDWQLFPSYSSSIFKNWPFIGISSEWNCTAPCTNFEGVLCQVVFPGMLKVLVYTLNTYGITKFESSSLSLNPLGFVVQISLFLGSRFSESNFVLDSNSHFSIGNHSNNNFYKSSHSSPYTHMPNCWMSSFVLLPQGCLGE
jgi:hypothetical protein